MLKRIRSLVSNFNFNPSFIEIYDNALTKEECTMVMNQFAKSSQADNWGYTSQGFQPEQKKCKQITGGFDDNSVISTITYRRLCECMKKYNLTYLALGKASYWRIHKGWSFQKYEEEDDGYKVWHCEHGPSPNDGINRRIMAWMVYLNDAKCGTEFMSYPTIDAKMGRCVIWPAAWTHTHRGVCPNKGLKYIITGWVTYDTIEEVERTNERIKSGNPLPYFD